MMTVHEVNRLVGVSIRTLQYYDKIGLLLPSSYSDSGYRLYDNSKPWFSLKVILKSPDLDRDNVFGTADRIAQAEKCTY